MSNVYKYSHVFVLTWLLSGTLEDKAASSSCHLVAGMVSSFMPGSMQASCIPTMPLASKCGTVL